MDHGLAAHVSFCRFADRWIFLDVARDRYVGAKIDRVAGDDQPDLNTATVERLIAAGLLIRGHQARPMRAPTNRVPLYSFLENSDARPALAHMQAAIVPQLRARVALRRRPLLDLLNDVRRRKRAQRRLRVRPPELATLVASFHRMRRRLPFAPRCLPDSLALLAYLDRYGYSPDLIFGVMAHPFAAHCWVQDEVCLFNDTCGHAAQFTPILVL